MKARDVALAGDGKSNATTNSWSRGNINNLPVRSGARARIMRRRSSSFSSSSFHTTTTATAIDAAPANDAEAPAKDSSEEDAADRTAVADCLVNSLAANVDQGGVGGSQGKAIAGFRLYGSDHTTNNADTGQGEAGEE